MAVKEFKPSYFVIDFSDGIAIATVTQPSLCEEDNIEQFGVELNQVIESFGSFRLVIDLSHVTIITSSAIGKLIGTHRNLHRRDGKLVLCGVTGVVQNVLATSKLNDYFHITPTVEAALNLIRSNERSKEPPTVAKPR